MTRSLIEAMTSTIQSPPATERSAALSSKTSVTVLKQRRRTAKVELLATEHVCGQMLLRLVSRGNTLVAEIVRMSDRVPALFAEPAVDLRHALLTPSFVYFDAVDAFQVRLDTSAELQTLDDQLNAQHAEILQRFFALFDSVHDYGRQLSRFVEEVNDGQHIGHTVETLFEDTDGRQLLCEALYLYGVLLLLLDRSIGGSTRERLIVAYYRYHGTAQHTTIDDVCALLRCTGYEAKAQPQPVGYPHDYLSRTAIDEEYIGMVISALRSDDMYNQLSAFASPQHRSCALSMQASMLYICLYFDLSILHAQTSTMREIVDHYFSQDWCVVVYMGVITDNLVEAWQPYKAASMAIRNTVIESNVVHIANKQASNVSHLRSELTQLLNEGALHQDVVLTQTTRLVNTARTANATLRWMMLHTSDEGYHPTNAKCTQLRDLVMKTVKYDKLAMLQLLVHTAQFELTLKEVFQSILSTREQQCRECCDDVRSRFEELAQVFSGEKPLTRVKKNVRLQQWFEQLAVQMSTLQFDGNTDVSSKKLTQMCNRLAEVRDLHSLDAHASVAQFLSECDAQLKCMLRLLNVNEHLLWQLQTVADFSYGWLSINQFTEVMQESIKNDATMANRLRALFLKLSTSFDLPLMRIAQANSPDLAVVSQLYSQRLVGYIRDVLQVIPASVFQLLNRIAHLQTTCIADLPTKIERGQLAQYAALEHRYEVSKLSHAISVLTEGMLAMKTTLVGIIRIEPTLIFEDGIRRELTRRVALTMNNALIFTKLSTKRCPPDELNERLTKLAMQMTGFRRSFSYISDYMMLDALAIWQQEFTRIVGFYVEVECNAYLKHSISEEESMFQSRVVPVPSFGRHPVDSPIETCAGRLMHTLFEHTHPATTVYVDALHTWYDATGKKVARLSPPIMEKLSEAISLTGLAGLTRLIGFDLVHGIRGIMTSLRNDEQVATVATSLTAVQGMTVVTQPYKLYDSIVGKSDKMLGKYAHKIAEIGQRQLLRDALFRQQANVAQENCQLLEETTANVNVSLLGDMAKSGGGMPSRDNALLFELSQYLQISGRTSTQHKQFAIDNGTRANMGQILFAVTLWMSHKVTFNVSSGLLDRKGAHWLDHFPFVVGVATVIKHAKDVHETSDVFRQHIRLFLRSVVREACQASVSNGQVVHQIKQSVPSMLFIAQRLYSIMKWDKCDMMSLDPYATSEHS